MAAPVSYYAAAPVSHYAAALTPCATLARPHALAGGTWPADLSGALQVHERPHISLLPSSQWEPSRRPAACRWSVSARRRCVHTWSPHPSAASSAPASMRTACAGRSSPHRATRPGATPARCGLCQKSQCCPGQPRCAPCGRSVAEDRQRGLDWLLADVYRRCAGGAVRVPVLSGQGPLQSLSTRSTANRTRLDRACHRCVHMPWQRTFHIDAMHGAASPHAAMARSEDNPRGVCLPSNVKEPKELA